MLNVNTNYRYDFTTQTILKYDDYIACKHKRNHFYVTAYLRDVALHKYFTYHKLKIKNKLSLK